jgi:hypothetical protein
VAELRRGIEGGVYYWLVHHGAEVGSGSVRGSGARREAEPLDRLREEEGCRPPPPLGWASWATWVVQADWPAGLTGPKARKEFFQI